MISLIASTIAETGSASPGSLKAILDAFGIKGWYFGAQLLNFFIVVLVLKKFAFGPIQAMLEQRRSRIAEGEEKLKRIEKQLAESEATTTAAIEKANQEAVRLIQEAKDGAHTFSEQKAQEAIAQAQNILTKAEAAAKADRDRLTTELKREFGRLVAATTSQVTGKVLTADDQKRINEDALAKVEG
jgi:F-type H+-transporting ATPase subunit b